VPCACLTLIIYGMSGLRAAPLAVAQNAVLSTLMSLIAVQVMHACAVFAPTQDAAFMYSIAWTSIQLLFNNFAIILTDISLPWLAVVKNVSAAYFAFEGLSIVEFSGLTVPCAHGGADASTVEFLRELLPNTPLLKSRAATAMMARPDPDCVLKAAPVLDYFDFSRAFSRSVVILLGYWAVTHLATYAALRAVARHERR
jgi:hypothetical protein